MAKQSISTSKTIANPRKPLKNLRRSKTKASFFRAFESGPRQGWEAARAVVSCENIFSLSCSYPLKTIVSAASCLIGLQVSLRLAPKNYPSEGNFLEASRVNVELVVVQISWQENPTRTPGTFTSNLPFQASPEVCQLHTLNHSHNANDAQSTAPPGRKAQTQRRGTLVPNVFRLFRSHIFPLLVVFLYGTRWYTFFIELCHTPSENKIHEKQRCLEVDTWRPKQTHAKKTTRTDGTQSLHEKAYLKLM